MLVVINPCNLYMSSDYYLSISHYQYRMPLDTDLYILDTDDLIVEKVSYTKLLEIYKRDITSFSINNLKYRNHKDYEGIGLKTSIDLLNKSYALEATLFNSEDLRIKPYTPSSNTDLELLVHGKFYHIELEYDYKSFDDYDREEKQGTFDYHHLLSINKKPLLEFVIPNDGFIAFIDDLFGIMYPFKLGDNLIIRLGYITDVGMIIFSIFLVFNKSGSFVDYIIVCNDSNFENMVHRIKPEATSTFLVKYKTLKHYEKY